MANEKKNSDAEMSAEELEKARKLEAAGAESST